MQTSYRVYFDTLKIIDFIEGLDVDLKKYPKLNIINI